MVNGYGVAGVVLYSLCALITVFRVRAHLRHGLLPLTTRKVFHILGFIFSVLQIPDVVDTANNGRFRRGTYTLHLLGSSVAVMMFSTVIILWARTLSSGKASKAVPPFMILMNVVYFVFTLFICGGIWHDDDGVDDYVSHNDAYKALLIVNGAMLLLLAVSLLALGTKMHFKLTSHPHWAPLATPKRRKVLCKLNSIMLVCSGCYLLRVLFVTLLFADATGNGAWMVLGRFVPDVIPLLLLVFMMRKVDTPEAIRTSQNYTPVPNVAPRHSGTVYRQYQYPYPSDVDLDAEMGTGHDDLSQSLVNSTGNGDDEYYEYR